MALGICIVSSVASDVSVSIVVVVGLLLVSVFAMLLSLAFCVCGGPKRLQMQ